jgi:hypothetical protein
VGLQAEVSVDQAGVETEILQPGLQCGDVVAIHRRTELMMQGARTQPIRSFPQRPVGGFADDAVDKQPAVLLKRPHRVVELVVEYVERNVPSSAWIRIHAIQMPQRGQRSPNVGDRGVTVTTAQRFAVAVMRSRHSKGLR